LTPGTMKIDGYIIEYGGTYHNYTPATILEVGKTTVKVQTDRGVVRIFNLYKPYDSPHLPPTKGHELRERGKGGSWTFAPRFDMDVETIAAEAAEAMAARNRRDRYRKANGIIDAFQVKNRHNLDHVTEAEVMAIEAAATALLKALADNP
jgi:hypothetical protein